MRRFVWPVAEYLKASRPVKAPCGIHHWMFWRVALPSRSKSAGTPEADAMVDGLS